MSPTPMHPGEIVVSIVVPAYNAETWLPLTLESACNQTLREVEILVVDDESSDRTAEIARGFAARDPRVRLISRKNGGVGAARNSAIAEARGKYIAPLDADDLWHPEKLADQVACMEAGGEQMGMCYCWSEKIDARGQQITTGFPFEIQGSVLRPMVLRNFVGCGSVPLFRSTALHQIGNYLERSEQGGVQGCEDWDLSLRVAEHYQVGLVRRCLVGYRQIADCMSLNAEGMSRSYEVIMTRAKARNTGLAPEVYRWSAGNFYSYLVAKCYLWGDYTACLHSMARAVLADLMLFGNRRFYLMALKSLVRIATGTRDRPPGFADPDDTPGKPQRSSWAESVQLRRWHEAIATTGSLPKS
ncbi:glycosyltransferase family 2 protein [Luteolibacter soli]|uniref:Glycosyltransferase family 2 protein n=1 Tax=Luteolibacter soli TaxID=3135280 RepID=A0ABU9ATE2_9BACT